MKSGYTWSTPKAIIVIDCVIFMKDPATISVIPTTSTPATATDSTCPIPQVSIGGIVGKDCVLTRLIVICIYLATREIGVVMEMIVLGLVMLPLMLLLGILGRWR